MTARLLKVLLALFVALSSFCFVNAQGGRTITNIDADWRFYLGDAENGQKPSFNDAAWRKLNVPHDWSIEGEYDQNNPTGSSGGYLPAGIGWYRKNLVIPESESGNRIFVEFEGVMANSEVWINGKSLGKRPYGYSTFEYELTGNITFGAKKPNVLAVRADNSVQRASRWYTGCGIYRHVHIISVNPVHLGHWGVYITTPKISATQATVSVQSSVVNQSVKDATITVQTVVTGPDGKSFKSDTTALTVAAGDSATCIQEIAVAAPRLWDIDNPNLYKAVTTVNSGKKAVDNAVNTFGIRETHFEAATGFYLNGKNIKILGVCLHHDGGPVGSAVPAEVWRYRLARLKEIGVNAIRTAHNPMAPTFYEVCDQMGLMVMDETFDTWTIAKPGAEKGGYQLYFKEWWAADTRDMVMRDRNHPSVIIYSVGNEIHDQLNSDEGRQRFLDQRNLIHKLDPTRPVTMALFRPNNPDQQVYNNGFSELMDIVGQNYRVNELTAAWKAKPERKVIGTENVHDASTWTTLRDSAYMSGQFLWTGLEYLGEAAMWPAIGWSTALLDRNGGWKPLGYQRQSWWSTKPMVKIIRAGDNAGTGGLAMDWTPVDFGTYDEARISVYSNCDEVELFLNGTSKGKLPINKNASPRIWNIGFEQGSIKAVGYNKGQQVAVDEMKTSGTPVKVQLTAQKTSVQNTWDDVVYVKATIVDKNGICNPNLNPKLTFKISGPGTILSVDNSSPTSHEKYKATERTAYQGEALALIQANANSGKITLSVSAEGLEGTTITINAVPAK